MVVKMVIKYIDTAGIAFTYANMEIDYFLGELLPCKEDFKTKYLVENPLVEGSDEFILPEYEFVGDLSRVAESRSGYHNEDEVPENLCPHELASVAAFIDRKTLEFNLYHQQGHYIFFHHINYRLVFEIDISKFSMPSSYRNDPYFIWKPKVIVFRNYVDHQENATKYIRARYEQILNERISSINKSLTINNDNELIRQKMLFEMMAKRARILKLEDSKFQKKPFYIGDHILEFDT